MNNNIIQIFLTNKIFFHSHKGQIQGLNLQNI